MRSKIEEKNISALAGDIQILIGELQRMILVEEMRLLPNSLELLKEEDWKEMRIGEDEIGWAFDVLPVANIIETEKIKDEPLKTSKTSQYPQISGIPLNEGFLNIEQIYLMLQFLPVDLTYVDENDRVLFYNRGEERVFPRSPAVLVERFDFVILLNQLGRS